jgi:pimeloyl-ACP methyl ester carboxylesterase
MKIIGGIVLDNFIILSDGRKLSYIEYGDREGIPVLLFHGTPGSKAWFLNDDETAKELKIKLIALDRPGYGRSDNKPGRTLLDWTTDVEEFIESLNLIGVSIIGVSGGGAYAAACANKLAHKLVHVSMVSSIAPFINGKPPESMLRENRMAFFLGKYVPWLLRLSYNAQKKMIDSNPAKFKESLRKGNKHLNEWDRQFLQTDEQLEAMTNHLREAFVVRVDEVVNEMTLLSQKWGFKLSEINFPIHIWHGEEDRMAPFEKAMEMALNLPQSKFHKISNAGHFLIDDSNVWGSILSTIKQDHIRLFEEGHAIR